MSGLFLRQEEFENIFTSHLKIETYSKSIDTLFGVRLLNRINYQPYYQRNYVWDNHKASYFIESILLGTEIPPLIFFNNGKDIEVIDGRQRFETIKRFKDNQFALTSKGLSTLKQLVRSTYDSLVANLDTANIIDLFLEAKVRIIEFEIVNEPRLDTLLEDKIKKEIFSRYNSGITPLKKPDIDNAVYDKDPVSKYFKDILKKNKEFVQLVHSIFFKKKADKKVEPDVGKILQFIRRYLFLNRFPIKYYAGGHSRTETLAKLYDYLSNSTENIESLCSSFIEKIPMVHSMSQSLSKLGLQHNPLVSECLLWSLLILENENFDLSRVTNDEFIKHIGRVIIVRENVGKHRDWFHLKLAKSSNDRDRMENEELYTSLAYLEFRKLKEQNIRNYLYIYQQNNRINARIGSAKDITNVLTEASETQEAKKSFLDCIKSIETFISKLKLVLLDRNITDKNELKKYFSTELDSLFKGRRETRSFRRTKQDFYILWYALNAVNLQMVKFHRLEIKKELQDIFFNMKSILDTNPDDCSHEKIIDLMHEFHHKYRKEERKLRVSETEKEELIRLQENRCAVSGTPIFMGDEIEVDHDMPLAIGGADSMDNLQITHKDSNRSKGVKYRDT